VAACLVIGRAPACGGPQCDLPIWIEHALPGGSSSNDAIRANIGASQFGDRNQALNPACDDSLHDASEGREDSSRPKAPFQFRRHVGFNLPRRSWIEVRPTACCFLSFFKEEEWARVARGGRHDATAKWFMLRPPHSDD